MQTNAEKAAPPGQPAPECAQEPIWVSVKDGIRLSSIKRTRFYELLRDKTLRSAKIGGRRLVSYASIKSLGQEECVATLGKLDGRRR